MTRREQILRESRNFAGTWQALALLYGVIVAAMVLTAAAIV